MANFPRNFVLVINSFKFDPAKWEISTSVWSASLSGILAIELSLGWVLLGPLCLLFSQFAYYLHPAPGVQKLANKNGETCRKMRSLFGPCAEHLWKNAVPMKVLTWIYRLASENIECYLSGDGTSCWQIGVWHMLTDQLYWGWVMIIVRSMVLVSDHCAANNLMFVTHWQLIDCSEHRILVSHVSGPPLVW